MQVDPTRPPSRGPAPALAALLLLLFGGLAVNSLRQKSVTTDELMYVAAGVHHWETGTFDLNRTNPPLMKLWVAAPLVLLLDLELPEAEGDPRDWGELEQWRWARAFLYENTADPDRILLLARLPMVALGLVLGAYVFAWSRRLFGDRGALMSLTLYALSPNVLAHARLATTDLGLALFLFAAAYHVARFVERPGARQLACAGLALAGAVLSKSAGMFLLPAFVGWGGLLWLSGSSAGTWERWPLVRRIPERLARARQALSLAWLAAALGAVMLVGLNAGYLFRAPFQPVSQDDDHPALYERLPVDHPATRALADLAVETPLPLPGDFVAMLGFQFGRVSAGNNVYFRGATSRSGWHPQMAYAFLVKTPLPALGLFAAAAFALLASRRGTPSEGLAWCVVLFTAALFTYLKSVHVGLRYVLPVFPFLHLLAGRLAEAGRPLGGPRGALLLVALAWYAVGTLRIHPHHLAHFNELVGPANGWKHLVDSNLDWGQDLPGLARWMKEEDVPEVRLAYFGSADAHHHGVEYELLPSVFQAPARPDDPWSFETSPERFPALELDGPPIAVSATLLGGVFLDDYYAPLRELDPVARIGYSILVFDLRHR